MIEVKDRIPTYPGRVKLIPVAGQANTYDLVRADEPIEAGTPINKALFESINTEMESMRQQIDNALFELSNRLSLSSIAEGTEFGLYENGVLIPYIKLRNSYNSQQRVVVIRKDIIKLSSYVISASLMYEDSIVDRWLNNEYISYLDDTVRAVLEAVNIQVATANSVTALISRKAFLLTGREYGIVTSGSMGDATYSFFNSNSRRRATYNGTPYAQWTRDKWSPHAPDTVCVSQLGERLDTANGVTDQFGIRPALTLPLDFPVIVGTPKTSNVMATAEVI